MQVANIVINSTQCTKQLNLLSIYQVHHDLDRIIFHVKKINLYGKSVLVESTLVQAFKLKDMKVNVVKDV